MERFDPQVHRASLQGGTCAWLEAGPPDGPVALCLHGFPDHPRTFEPILGALVGAGYRVVAPWLRGYAPSTLDGPFHAARLGADAVELAAAVAPEGRVLLVGHDWGAMAAWHAAARAPGRVAQLVALSVPHPRAIVRNLRRHPLQLLRGWYVGLFQLPLLPEKLLAAGDAAAVRALFRAASVPPGRTPAYLDEALATLRASLPGPLGPYRALRRRGAGKGALRVRVPTLFLTGSLEPAIRPELCEGQERWVDAPFASHVIEGAGHFVHHDQPAAVARHVLRFAGRG